jgi:exodeoxyribonuclease V alpha subunit
VQFRARFLRTSPPTSVDGVAKKLVRVFGEKVFDVIEATPDRLREVDGKLLLAERRSRSRRCGR